MKCTALKNLKILNNCKKSKMKMKKKPKNYKKNMKYY